MNIEFGTHMNIYKFYEIQLLKCCCLSDLIAVPGCRVGSDFVHFIPRWGGENASFITIFLVFLEQHEISKLVFKICSATPVAVNDDDCKSWRGTGSPATIFQVNKSE